MNSGTPTFALTYLGCNEVHTANGRMDSVIFAGDYIYILEFKIDKPPEDALWQIEDKDYASI